MSNDDKVFLITHDTYNQSEVSDDEDEKSKIIIKTRLDNFQSQTDHSLSKTTKLYVNNQKESQKFIDKS